MVHEHMNKIPGVYCNEVDGAMYAFPRIDIPEEAKADAAVRLISQHLHHNIHKE